MARTRKQKLKIRYQSATKADIWLNIYKNDNVAENFKIWYHDMFACRLISQKSK